MRASGSWVLQQKPKTSCSLGCKVWLQTVHKSHSKHSGGTFSFPSHTYRHVDLSSETIVSLMFCLSLPLSLALKGKGPFFFCLCYSSLAPLHPCGILSSTNGCWRTNLMPSGAIYLCMSVCGIPHIDIST